MPTFKWLKSHFSYGYDSGDVLSQETDKRRANEESSAGGSYRELFQQTAGRWVKPDAQVLELGPGRGSWTRALLQQAPQGCVHTLDFQDVSEWLKPDDHRGHLFCHHIHDNRFKEVPDSQFDFFFSFGVLCHNNRQQIQEVLESSLAKMKPGGLAVHEYGEWDKLQAYGWQKGGVPAEFAKLPDDQIWWPRNTAGQMAALAQQAGWEVLSPDLGLLQRDGVIALQRPDEITAQLREGVALMHQRKMLASIKTLTAAVEADPQRLGSRRHLATALNQAGRHEEALAAYREEAQFAPHDPFIQQRIADLSASIVHKTPTALSTAKRGYATSIPRDFLLTLQNVLHNFTYAGVPTLKNPFDLAIYPRVFHDLKPATIIEIGSKAGGSALWMGDQVVSLQLPTRIHSVDLVKVTSVSHPRVTFHEGDAHQLELVLTDAMLAELPRPWLVIDDADHVYDTCKAISIFFDRHLKPGDMLVVEDGIISDLVPNDYPDCTSGPHRAIKELLAAHPGRYEIAGEYCDMFGYNATWCTNGFLRRVQ